MGRLSYRLTDAKDVHVELRNCKSNLKILKHLKDLPQGEWCEATLTWPTPRNGKLGMRDTAVDEIRFTLPSGQLLVDDVLLYEPGARK